MPPRNLINTQPTHIRFESGVRFLVKYLPPSRQSSRKPILFHNIRVGVYLYEHSYSEDVVLAGLLHDTLEWSSATENIIKKEFGQAVRDLIMANTKDDRIKNNDEKVTELIQRCAKHGEDALIVKTADILDSFKWYSSQNNEDELQNYCAKNAKAIFKFKPSSFNDKIFKALKSWQVKYAN